MGKQPAYEPVQAVDDAAGRAERARNYMVKMSAYADAGLLGSETLFRLQTCSGLRLAKDADGKWTVVDPDVTENVTKPPDVTKPAPEFRDTPRGGRPSAGDRAMTAAERKRAQRARERGE